MKVVSGEDAATLERVADAYGAIIDGRRAPRAVDQGRRGRQGHREHAARSQHRADERARDHLRSHGHPHRATCSRRPARSGTSSSSRPGLVGGHCIGVDPYYLTTKAQQLGYQPEVILAGRRINNNIGPYVAQRLVKMLINAGIAGEGRARRRARADVQGGLQRPAQQQGAGHPRRAAQFGIDAMIHDSARQPGRGPSRVRRQAEPARGVQEPRRPDRRGEPQGVPPARPAQAAVHGARQRLLRRRQERVRAGEDGARHPVLEPLGRASASRRGHPPAMAAEAQARSRPGERPEAGSLLLARRRRRRRSRSPRPASRATSREPARA